MPWWIRQQLSMPGQLIRQDRIMDEAYATAGDIRALCDLVGLSTGSSRSYALLADRVGARTLDE
jgi:hypothetical protein